VRIIRASEIGTYLFCRRAWKYQRKEVPSDNVREMAVGTDIHRQHGRRVFASGCLRTVAMAMLLAAMIMLVIHFLGSAL
jgi:hypothetical protein